MVDDKKPLKSVLRIDFPPDERLGRGKMMLLQLIIETGSISAAGRAMDMSYRRAWLLVDALNHMFSELVVDTRHGGKQGGGAVVTPFGLQLLSRYRQMEQKLAHAISDDILWLERHRKQVPISEEVQ